MVSMFIIIHGMPRLIIAFDSVFTEWFCFELFKCVFHVKPIETDLFPAIIV